ncbi:MAG: translation elongation factor Ts [Patescibacteria group bacterium]|jgi:elongation factor Ts
MELLKQLRQITGAGMVDCQKALKETNNNLEEAVDLLRKKGIAKASKRTDREANEGVIKVATNEEGTEGYIVEMNSETDFVSRNETFQEFAETVLKVIKETKPQNLEELLAAKMTIGSVQEDLDNLSGTIGEKMSIKRFDIITGSTVTAYSHLGGKIGVLVALDTPGQAELAKEIAMQVAAAQPKYLDSSEVDAGELAREMAIHREQLAKEGKPEEMITKILAGKEARYYSEVCLVDQEYIKEDKQKVKDILGEVKVLKFVNYTF